MGCCSKARQGFSLIIPTARFSPEFFNRTGQRWVIFKTLNGCNYMNETGVVVKKWEGRILVHFVPGTSCSHCSIKGSCLDSGGEKELEVVDEIGASVGQRVSVEIKDKKLFFGWALFYLFPTICFIAGLGFGDVLASGIGISPGIVSFSLAGVGVGIYFLLLRVFSKHVEHSIIPRVAGIVE